MVDRVHLVIDVLVRGNAAFDQHFLQAFSPESRQKLLSYALSSEDASAAQDVFGMHIARQMAGEMSRRFGALFASDLLREAYERAVWDKVLSTVMAGQQR